MAIVLPKLPRRRPTARWTAHSAPTLTVALCRADGRYSMGQPLAAHWHLSQLAEDTEIDGLEASVMWYTEGKGDEDLHVHHFHRWSGAELAAMDLEQSHGWGCQLPLTPLSYEGTLLRIRWCVRLRLFCKVGRDSVAQVPFQLLPDPLESNSDAVGEPAATATVRRSITADGLTAAADGLVARVGQLSRFRPGRRTSQRAGLS